MSDSPELSALRHRRDAIRIPDETDVPLTPRVRRLIDTSPFRRLASIPQLGLVSWVYPGATHSRFEHSLGVYRNALLFVDALRVDARFRDTLQGEELDRLIVAALLHDVGHWPFCHPIEDLSLAGVPHHEAFATQWLNSDEIRTALAEDWGLTPESIVRTLDGPYETSAERMAASVLSGPIDVDKLDYLVRDSLHAGVPYGRNFDRSRLIGGLCLDAAGARLALDEKAKTAAEMMVFARYVMFSEVYWHHAVRAATAMFQRAFYEAAMLRGEPTGEVDWSDWFRDDHAGFIRRLMQTLEGTRWLKLADGLFGARRRLWKRWAQYSAFDGGEVGQLCRSAGGYRAASDGDRVGGRRHPDRRATSRFGGGVPSRDS